MEKTYCNLSSIMSGGGYSSDDPELISLIDDCLSKSPQPKRVLDLLKKEIEFFTLHDRCRLVLDLHEFKKEADNKYSIIEFSSFYSSHIALLLGLHEQNPDEFNFDFTLVLTRVIYVVGSQPTINEFILFLIKKRGERKVAIFNADYIGPIKDREKATTHYDVEIYKNDIPLTKNLLAGNQPMPSIRARELSDLRNDLICHFHLISFQDLDIAEGYQRKINTTINPYEVPNIHEFVMQLQRKESFIFRNPEFEQQIKVDFLLPEQWRNLYAAWAPGMLSYYPALLNCYNFKDLNTKPFRFYHLENKPTQAYILLFSEDIIQNFMAAGLSATEAIRFRSLLNKRDFKSEESQLYRNKFKNGYAALRNDGLAEQLLEDLVESSSLSIGKDYVQTVIHILYKIAAARLLNRETGGK